MTGTVELVEKEGDHMIAAHSIDSTPGQDGGPLTMNDGTVVGIYSNVEEYGADSYYMVQVINDTFLNWFNNKFGPGV
jgi:V8-like Glu-specific endopeptidase